MDLRGIGRKCQNSIKTPRKVYSSPTKKLSKWVLERICNTFPIAIPAELLINRIPQGNSHGFVALYFYGAVFFAGNTLELLKITNVHKDATNVHYYSPGAPQLERNTPLLDCNAPEMEWNAP